MNPEPDFFHRAEGSKYFDGERYRGDGILLNAAIFGGIGIYAGQKFYARWRPYADTPELVGASIRHGAIMAIRWKAWFVTVCWLLASIPFWLFIASGLPSNFYSHVNEYGDDGSVKPMDITGDWLLGTLATAWGLLALQIFLGFFAVGVTYNQAIRESLFQRRWFFRAMLPFERIAGRLPWQILHSTVVIPLVILIVTYNR